MAAAQEVDEIIPGIFIWQVYDKTVKAELFSTGLETPAGTWLVDPIPLTAEALASFQRRPAISGIFLTNNNHARAARHFAGAFAVPLLVHVELAKNVDFPAAIGVHDGETFSEGLTAIAIEGGPPGEMALHYDDGGGTLVVGDALINFQPHGFELLPAKYCQNAKLMRQSLEKLLHYSFERMFFAHGTPILSEARARLKQLLSRTS